MESGAYLHRLGAADEDIPFSDIDALAELQRLHVQTVPFTNFYVRNGDGTSLDADEVVPRIIASGGGLCYDLNRAFAWLLAKLGYEVTFLSGRVNRGDGSFGPAYDHIALLVDDHVVDVGFGDFARQPLSLTGDPHTDVSGTYRVLKREGHYTAQKQTADGWTDEYRFETTARMPDEFAEMADYHATSPDSPFTGDLLATRATEHGRVTLSGDTLTITEHGERRKRHVPPERVNDLLRDEFRLS